MARFGIFCLFFLGAHGVDDLQVVSNDFSFAMVNVASGLAACWGDAKYGGNCSSVDFTGVLQVEELKRW